MRARRLAGDVEHLVEGQLADGLAWGMQVVVTKDRETCVDLVVGTTPDGTASITPDTRFALYSASKPLTATALHVLVERGLVDYDDRVAKHLPDFAQHGKDDITLAHLLLHVAGLADEQDTPLPEAYRSIAGAVSRVCDLTPEHAPGERVTYHALSASAVIAALVESIAGVTFPDFCEREVFTPFGMSETTWGKAKDAPATDTVGIGDGQDRLAGAFREASESGAVIPGGGAWSTARDMARFYEQWLVCVRDGGPLSSEVARRAIVMHMPFVPGLPLGFGYGFMVGAAPWSSRGDVVSQATFGHPGWCSTQALCDPERGLVIVALANGGPPQTDSDQRFATLCDLVARGI